MTTASIRRRTIRGVSLFILIATIAVTAVLVAPQLTGHQLYAITSGSMTGTADIGSLVISEPVPINELVVGDVITYLPPAETAHSQLVTHRIVAIDDDAYGLPTFTTKGDANTAVDPWTFRLDASIQPRMRVAVPWMGYPILWLADRTIRMFAIGLPALVIALIAARDLVRALRRPVTSDSAMVIDAPFQSHPALDGAAVSARP